MQKLTKQQMDYYEAPDGLEMTLEESNSIDEDRVNEIVGIAEYEVNNGQKKQSRANFKSDAEYKLYLLSVYDASLRAGM